MDKQICRQGASREPGDIALNTDYRKKRERLCRHKMKIIIIGCGKIGTTILSSLVAEGHDIVAVDSDNEVLSEIINIYDVMLLGGSRTAHYLADMLTAGGVSVKIIERDEKTCSELCEAIPKAVIIHGDGAQQELLLEEGLRSLDAFVSLTGMDEENILISIFAAAQKVPKVISKINRDELASLAERLGLDCIVSPKKIISDVLVQYARALQNSLGSNIETLYKLMDGKAEALEFNVRADSKLTGIPLKDLNIKPNILIAGILRYRKTIIPAGDDVIMPDDRVIIVAADQRLSDLSDILK